MGVWRYLLVIGLWWGAEVQPAPRYDSAHWLDVAAFQDCGAVSLMVLGELSGHDWRLDDVRKVCPPDESGGTTAQTICAAGERLGLPLDVLRCEFKDLPKLAPCIAHLRELPGRCPAHFCVIAAVQADKVLIVDPPMANEWAGANELSKRWDGVVIAPANRPSSNSVTSHRILLAGASALAFLAGVGIHRLSTRIR